MNGVRSKLECDKVHKMLLKYDVVGLNEVKTSQKISVPGFVSFTSDKCDRKRGGTVVLVKRCLQSKILSVDTSMKDQVWLRLSPLCNMLIGFCYIPPSDSQYFNPYSFSYIQEKVRWSEDEGLGVIVMGDLNSRFGTSVRNILKRAEIPDSHTYTYPFIADPVEGQSNNASILITICRDHKLYICE